WYSRSTFEHRIKTPTPLFGITCCKYSYLADFDPCVTQRFPLGDPEFSTGSPKDLHRVTQASSFQQRVATRTFLVYRHGSFRDSVLLPSSTLNRFLMISYFIRFHNLRTEEIWAHVRHSRSVIAFCIPRESGRSRRPIEQLIILYHVFRS